MILSTLLTVLALAGAPSTTTVQCNPALTSTTELGVTFSSVVTVLPDGRIVPGVLDIVQLGPMACGALLWASAATSERAAIKRLNPGVDFDRLVGVGLQVALHEANHVALNSTNECLAEKKTRAEINGLIERVGGSKAAETDATASDAALPAIYHGC